jgi:hypothetical protein
MLEDRKWVAQNQSSPIDISLDDYIRDLDISDKWINVFKAYKISLNKSKNEIVNILSSEHLKEDNILLNQIAYKISIELEKEMTDTNYRVQRILEWALWIEHNYIKAA